MGDPGFPIGGHQAVWGAPTSDAGTFRQKHMRKWKNWILLGGRASTGSAPLDPPIIAKCDLFVFPQCSYCTLLSAVEKLRCDSFL